MLTPVDIQNKEFTKAFRGYDAIEVDDFMQTLVLDYEKLYRENASLKEKNAIISETLENYKGMESTMQNAILVAQKTSEDIRQNAHDRAQTIIKEAEAKAKDIISNAEKRSLDLDKDFSSLKKEMTTFKARMNSLLTTYLRLLEDMPTTQTTAELPEEISAPAPKKEAPILVPDYTTSIMNAEKKKDNRAVSGDSYVPKKINPLVDELLKKREEVIILEDDEDDTHATLVVSKEELKKELEAAGTQEAFAEDSGEELETNIPEEILIDLKNTFKEQYDVFNDETL